MLAAGCQRLLEFGAGIALAALDLGELINEPPRAAVEVVHDGLTLSVEAEPGLSLLVCADPVIRDKPTEMRAHEALRSPCEDSIRTYTKFATSLGSPRNVRCNFPR